MKNLVVSLFYLSLIFTLISCQKKETWQIHTNSIGIGMIQIKPGSFMMGDQNDKGDYSEHNLMKSTATRIHNAKKYYENYSNGEKRIEYSAGISDDGRFLLHGTETWYYPDGHKQREATYKLGKKVGKETYRRPDGNIV